MKYLALLLTLFSASVVYAQPDITWQKAIGGSADEISFDIKTTKDKGYVICGYASSVDGDMLNSNSKKYGYSFDVWVAKYDSLNTLEWQKYYGDNGADEAYSIAQTADGGYVVCGRSSSNITGLTQHGQYDAYVLKLDDTGGVTWHKLIGGSNVDAAHSIVSTNDGGYIFTGMTGSSNGDVAGNHGGTDVWVVKLTSTGSISWQKCYGGNGEETGRSIKQVSGSGFVIAGHSNSSNGDLTANNGDHDIWLLKIDNNGIISWQKNFGGVSVEVAQDVIETTTGDFVVAGSTASSNNSGDVTGHNGMTDLWVVKTNGNGNITWQKTYGGSKRDSALHIIENAAGEYIVAGTTNSEDSILIDKLRGKNDMWILCLEKNGSLKWHKAIGGTQNDMGFSIAETTNKEYLVAGTTNSNDIDAYNSGFHPSLDTVERPDSWIVKLAHKAGVTVIHQGSSTVKVYPTVWDDVLNIELSAGIMQAQVSMVDISGKKISLATKKTGNIIQVSPNTIYPGIYILAISCAGQISTFKVIYRP